MPIIIDDGAVLRAMDTKLNGGMPSQDGNIYLAFADEQEPTPAFNAIAKRGPWSIDGDPHTGGSDVHSGTFEVTYEITLGEQSSIYAMGSACSAVRYVFATQGWSEGEHLIQVTATAAADPEGAGVTGRVTIRSRVTRIATTTGRLDAVNA